MNKESVKKVIKVSDRKMAQVSGGIVPVNLPEGVVVNDGYKCRKCGYICPTDRPPCKCPVCGGMEWGNS